MINESENWFSKSIILLGVLLIGMVSLFAAVVMTGGEFHQTGGLGAAASSGSASPYRLIPRSESISSKDTGSRAVTLGDSSLSRDSPPPGRIFLTVLRWNTVTTLVDGQLVTRTIRYDVVPATPNGRWGRPQ